MAKFLVAYRLKDDGGYDDRYQALVDALDEVGTGFWNAGTSLIAIETTLSIENLARALRPAVNIQTDLVFIREIDVKNTLVIGKPGNGFDHFFPEAKKL